MPWHAVLFLIINIIQLTAASWLLGLEMGIWTADHKRNLSLWLCFWMGMNILVGITGILFYTLCY